MVHPSRKRCLLNQIYWKGLWMSESDGVEWTRVSETEYRFHKLDRYLQYYIGSLCCVGEL